MNFNFKLKIFLIVTFLVLTFPSLLAPKVSASASGDSFTFCDIFPCPGPLAPSEGSSEDSVNNTVEEYVSFGLSVTFILIIVYGIFLVLKAAMTIIRSEGDAGKIQEGFSGMKAVVIGVAVIFVGLIGLIVVVGLFNGSGIFNPSVEAPDTGSDLPFID